MKGNNGTGNVAERDDWQTPQKLWDQLNEQYDFSTDCCASQENTKTPNHYTDFEKVNYLPFTSWMNPPFSKAHAMFEHFFKVVGQGVAIYRCDNMETKIWQEVILKHANWVLIPPKRINYEGKTGKGSRFPSALIGFNVEPPRLINGALLVIKR